ncbi:uncharacterized protein CLUP02_04469 [Colletotrichum lupini]|uniref:Uncharacterized protein n=1 Tax=Colletotrichum lupini TaxID=145971 RepID=A0A9Q8SKT3_9PEZI|nr:uncharacterized protein CLUP02_04469 [Colletotrichum lupini]UQC78990.1 hypothetical protein CLUP02_04469 [Colletotrichum lupini]
MIDGCYRPVPLRPSPLRYRGFLGAGGRTLRFPVESDQISDDRPGPGHPPSHPTLPVMSIISTPSHPWHAYPYSVLRTDMRMLSQSMPRRRAVRGAGSGQRLKHEVAGGEQGQAGKVRSDYAAALVSWFLVCSGGGGGGGGGGTRLLGQGLYLHKQTIFDRTVRIPGGEKRTDWVKGERNGPGAGAGTGFLVHLALSITTRSSSSFSRDSRLDSFDSEWPEVSIPVSVIRVYILAQCAGVESNRSVLVSFQYRPTNRKELGRRECLNLASRRLAEHGDASSRLKFAGGWKTEAVDDQSVCGSSRTLVSRVVGPALPHTCLLEVVLAFSSTLILPQTIEPPFGLDRSQLASPCLESRLHQAAGMRECRFHRHRAGDGDYGALLSLSAKSEVQGTSDRPQSAQPRPSSPGPCRKERSEDAGTDRRRQAAGEQWQARQALRQARKAWVHVLEAMALPYLYKYVPALALSLPSCLPGTGTEVLARAHCLRHPEQAIEGTGQSRNRRNKPQPFPPVPDLGIIPPVQGSFHYRSVHDARLEHTRMGNPTLRRKRSGEKSAPTIVVASFARSFSLDWALQGEDAKHPTPRRVAHDGCTISRVASTPFLSDSAHDPYRRIAKAAHYITFKRLALSRPPRLIRDVLPISSILMARVSVASHCQHAFFAPYALSLQLHRQPGSQKTLSVAVVEGWTWPRLEQANGDTRQNQWWNQHSRHWTKMGDGNMDVKDKEGTSKRRLWLSPQVCSGTILNKAEPMTNIKHSCEKLRFLWLCYCFGGRSTITGMHWEAEAGQGQDRQKSQILTARLCVVCAVSLEALRRRRPALSLMTDESREFWTRAGDSNDTDAGISFYRWWPLARATLPAPGMDGIDIVDADADGSKTLAPTLHTGGNGVKNFLSSKCLIPAKKRLGEG